MFTVTNGAKTKYYRYLASAANYMFKLGKGAKIIDKDGEIIWQI